MSGTQWHHPGKGPRTPWGRADSTTTYGLPGVVFYDTPSHGGFHLTERREAELDGKLRAVGLSAEDARMGYEPGWYEEDCSALAVLYAWPEIIADPAKRTPAEDLERLRYWIGSHEEHAAARTAR